VPARVPSFLSVLILRWYWCGPLSLSETTLLNLLSAASEAGPVDGAKRTPALHGVCSYAWLPRSLGLRIYGDC